MHASAKSLNDTAETCSFSLISHTVVNDNVEDGSSVCKYKYTNIVLLSNYNIGTVILLSLHVAVLRATLNHGV